MYRWSRTSGCRVRLFYQFLSGICFCQRRILLLQNCLICKLYQSVPWRSQNLRRCIPGIGSSTPFKPRYTCTMFTHTGIIYRLWMPMMPLYHRFTLSLHSLFTTFLDRVLLHCWILLYSVLLTYSDIFWCMSSVQTCRHESTTVGTILNAVLMFCLISWISLKFANESWAHSLKPGNLISNDIGEYCMKTLFASSSLSEICLSMNTYWNFHSFILSAFLSVRGDNHICITPDGKVCQIWKSF